MTYKKDQKLVRHSKLTLSEKRDKRKRQRWSRTIFFCVCIVFLIAGLNTGFSHLMGAIADVQKADAIQWKSGVEGRLWTFQKEVTVTAPESGTIEPVISQGARAHKGAKVAKLLPASAPSPEDAGALALSSPMAGIVSYTLDGFEALDTAETFQELSIAGIEKVIAARSTEEETPKNPKKAETSEEAAALIPAGSPAFKVIDNLSGCYVYFKTDQILDSWFREGEKILLLAQDGTEGSGIMQEYAACTEGSGMLLRLTSGLSSQRLQRENTVQMIIEEKSEASVPKAAVTTRKEIKGVYVYQDGFAHWRPVTIIEETDDQFILNGIEPGEWVVLRPWFVREGMRLKI